MRLRQVDPLMTAIGLCSGFVLMKDHPVVFLYGKDKDGQNLPKTAETVRPPRFSPLRRPTVLHSRQPKPAHAGVAQENPSAETDPTDPEADK